MEKNQLSQQEILKFGWENGDKIMNGALKILEEKLGKEYQYEKKIVPFALGEYLIVREDMINCDCVSINDMQDFDKMTRRIMKK